MITNTSAIRHYTASSILSDIGYLLSAMSLPRYLISVVPEISVYFWLWQYWRIEWCDSRLCHMTKSDHT